MGQDVIVDELGAFGRGSSLSGRSASTPFFLIPTFTLLHPASFCLRRNLSWDLNFCAASSLSLQHPGERQIVSYSRWTHLIGIFRIGGIGRQGLKSRAAAGPKILSLSELVWKHLLWRLVNINLAFSAAPPLRDPAGDFYACSNLPGQWFGSECVCFKMTVVMHEEDAPGWLASQFGRSKLLPSWNFRHSYVQMGLMKIVWWNHCRY